MLAAYFDIKPAGSHAVNPPKQTRAKGVRSVAAPVEAYDEQPTHASFRPSKHQPPPLPTPTPQDDVSDPNAVMAESDEDETAQAGDEYDYLLHEALAAHDPDEDTDVTDFEDEAPGLAESTSSLASSPDSHPEFLKRRTAQHPHRGPSETPVYAGPELWLDDEYSDFSDGGAFSEDEKNEQQEQ